MNPRTVVLVEGVSDRVAVLTLARRLGRDLTAEGVEVVDLGGATNVGRWLGDLVAGADHGRGVRLTGLYDAAEERFFRRGLERAGLGVVPDRDTLQQRGFFGCVEDLEDELIRALGVRRVEAVVEAQGDLASLHLMQRQPAQRGREPHHQLRRFLGTRSGRKATYAEALVEALDLDRLPTPLAGLLTRI